MKIQQYDNEEQWLEARLGRVTGTRLGDMAIKRGGGRKIGFYEIIAERIAIPRTNEPAMDRGHRLETLAIDRFSQDTGKKVVTDLVIWHRDEDDNIAISPDGYIETKVGKKKVVTEAMEVKCLAAARHLEAYLTQKIPSEYEEQTLQYFIVNDDLQVLYFCFYDPSMPKDFFWIELHRAELEEQIAEYLQMERDALAEIAKIEEQLTF